MKVIEQQLKSFLQQPYSTSQNFLQNVIFPVFGKKNFTSSGNLDVLSKHPELRPKADASGILKLHNVGQLFVDGSELDIFDITLDYKKQLQRNRVEIQQIIRSIISTFSGAFILFHYQSGARWEWRFTFCHKGDSADQSTDAKRYTFLLGPGQSCRTAAENFVKIHEKIEREGEFEMDDIINAFDVEALSKEFFDKYKRHYERFCQYVYDNRQDETLFGPFFATCPDKIIRDYVKKLLGRLVFLQFLQKKRWLGGHSSQWNDGDPDFLQHLFANATEEQKADFLDAVLEPLFQKALDANRAATNQDFDTGVEGFRNCKIPYLNGGLFGKDNGIDDANSDFPAEYFENLFNFFSQYNFTIDENDPNDAEVGIDPEMLGRIFENLLEDNKDKGAFYTPKPIVQYMCKESLIAYLQNGCKTERARQAARKFVETHDTEPLQQLHMETADGKMLEDSVLDFFDEMLRKVKVCDPAIGSGAFPMGMLRELYDCRSAIDGFDKATSAEIKKDIIQNNIYGVDIEKGAVDIARLRFWLTLILDEEDPKALPNLDFKIMQGNSLLESFYGVDLSNIAVGKQKATKSLKVNARTMQSSIFFHDEQEAMKEIQQSIRRYYCTDSRSAKQMLYAKIEYATRQYIYHLTEGRPDLQAEVENLPLCNDQFFLWHTFFADVFEQGGFDVVIGNPPYIQLQADGGLLGKLYQDQGFETFASTGDIYCLFYELGHKLLKTNGHLCYITSNKWMRTGYGEKLRNFLSSKTNPLIVLDFGGVQIFETANIDTVIVEYAVAENSNSTKALSMTLENAKEYKDLYSFFSSHCTIMSFQTSNSWIIKEKQFQDIKSHVENQGKPLCLWEIEIDYGIKTGFNDAFYVSTEQRNIILNGCVSEEERKMTKSLIRPMLRGKDIKPYCYNWADIWLIGTFPAKKFDIKQYPSVEQYLLSFGKERLEQTGKKYLIEGEIIKARKKTSNDWFETSDSIKYWESFDKPKIIYPNMTKFLPFVYDEEGIWTNQKCFILTGKHLAYLTAFFNSKLFKYCFSDNFPTLGEDRRELSKIFFEKIPVKDVSDEEDSIFRNKVLEIQKLKKLDPQPDTSALEAEIDRLIYQLYGLTEEEIKIVEGQSN